MGDVFRRIDSDSQYPGSEFGPEGQVLRLHAGLRDLVDGDIIQIQWEPINVQGGAWIKGLVTEKVLSDFNRADRSRVCMLKFRFPPGWHSAAFTSNVIADWDGEVRMALTPHVQESTVGYEWELCTDDCPNWDVYVIGHDCSGHPQMFACPVDKREKVFADARERIHGDG